MYFGARHEAGRQYCIMVNSMNPDCLGSNTALFLTDCTISKNFLACLWLNFLIYKMVMIIVSTYEIPVKIKNLNWYKVCKAMPDT